MLLLILAVNVVALAVWVAPVCVQMAREHRAYAAGRALASGYAAGLGLPTALPTARSVRARGLLVIQRTRREEAVNLDRTSELGHATRTREAPLKSSADRPPAVRRPHTRSQNVVSTTETPGLRGSPRVRRMVQQAQATHRAEEARFWHEVEDWETYPARTDQMVELEVLPNVRPTTVTEYAEFVRGHLEAGGEIRYVRDYPLRDNFVTAVRDFTLPPLFGAKSIDVLVPAGITVTRAGWGHSTILYMDGYRVDGAGLALFAGVAGYLDPRQ